MYMRRLDAPPDTRLASVACRILHIWRKTASQSSYTSSHERFGLGLTGYSGEPEVALDHLLVRLYDKRVKGQPATFS